MLACRKYIQFHLKVKLMNLLHLLVCTTHINFWNYAITQHAVVFPCYYLQKVEPWEKEEQTSAKESNS